MRYYLCCPKCGCKDLELDANSHYVCEECKKINLYDDLECEEE